jgi:hypothetical protein
VAIDEVTTAFAAQPLHTYTDLTGKSPTTPADAPGLYA